MQKNVLPIGIFDSGMGGLTVFRELVSLLPHESYVYLGDTARLPYGTKSSATIIRYALQMARVLVEQNVKLMVIACNTATTAALSYLQAQLPDLAILGVVEPAAQMAVCATRNHRIGVLATEATVKSCVYPTFIQRMNPEIQVFQHSCGLFVALAEEGCIDDEVARAAVKKYLAPMVQSTELCDTLLLGCTHFPVLLKSIRAVLGEGIEIVDSAKATAHAVYTLLQQKNLFNTGPTQDARFLITDLPERFVRVGEIFLGRPIDANSVHLM